MVVHQVPLAEESALFVLESLQKAIFAIISSFNTEYRIDFSQLEGQNIISLATSASLKHGQHSVAFSS